MAQNVAIGIDIGTHFTRAVVLQNTDNKITVAAIGTADSKGVRHGYITNTNEASKSIRTALKGVERTLIGMKLPHVCIAMAGVSLGGNIFQSSVPISRGEMEVTDEDITRVAESPRSDMPQAFSLNRRVIHSFPLQYKIDGRIVPGKPHGLKGSKLESRTLFITGLSNHIDNSIEAVDDAGFEVEDVVASPIARGNVLLTKSEKIAGVALVDIGAETVSVVVYENGLPISLEVFEIGSNDITNDIALGLKITLKEAEDIKKGIVANLVYPKKKVDDIIYKRLSEILTLIDDHFKKIGKSGLLPAGVVLSGGGAEIMHIELIAKNHLRLPTRRIEERIDNGSKTQIKSSEWAGAYGAAMFSLLNSTDEESYGLKVIGKKLGTHGKGILEWIKQFLP
jgi:cell division protein FtsA